MAITATCRLQSFPLYLHAVVLSQAPVPRWEGVADARRSRVVFCMLQWWSVAELLARCYWLLWAAGASIRFNHAILWHWWFLLRPVLSGNTTCSLSESISICSAFTWLDHQSFSLLPRYRRPSIIMSAGSCWAAGLLVFFYHFYFYYYTRASKLGT